MDSVMPVSDCVVAISATHTEEVLETPSSHTEVIDLTAPNFTYDHSSER